MRNIHGPAAASPAARADFDVTDRRLDTTTQYLPPTDLADARFQRAVAKLHRLGERPLYEMLVELGGRYLLRTEIETAVDRFSALNLATVDAVGARHFVVIPLHHVESAP